MEAANRNPMHRQPPVVLYVDDNLRSSRFLTAVLEECGFDVITANDPVEALGVCKNFAIDLALLDYDMPVMTGSQLAEELKFLVPDVPVVLLAGHASVSQSELVFVDGYFGPNTTLDDLIENLRTLVAADTMGTVTRLRLDSAYQRSTASRDDVLVDAAKRYRVDAERLQKAVAKEFAAKREKKTLKAKPRKTAA